VKSTLLENRSSNIVLDLSRRDGDVGLQVLGDWTTLPFNQMAA